MAPNKVSPQWDIGSSRQECSVSNALALSLRVSRFFGAAPVKIITRHEEQRVSVYPLLNAYGYLLILVLDIVLIAGLVIDLRLDPGQSINTRSVLTAVVWVAQVVVVLLVANVGVFSAPTRMSCMISCLNQISQLHNESIQNASQKAAVERKRYILMVICLASVGLLSCHNIDYNLNGNDSFDSTVAYLYIGYSIQIIITVLLETQFLHITLYINSAVASINESLITLMRIVVDSQSNNPGVKYEVELLDTSQLIWRKKQYSSVTVGVLHQHVLYPFGRMSQITNTAQDIVLHLSETYGKICEVLRELDGSNGLLLMLLLVSYVIYLLATMFFAVVMPNGKGRTLRGMFPVVNCLFHAINMITVIEPGHRTYSEMTRTLKLLGQFIRQSPSSHNPMVSELDLFAQHIDLNNDSYCPMGFCTLARPLIATIVNAVVTYLFIILQCQVLESA